MLNRWRSSSAPLDIVAKPLHFFVGLSACAFIEGSFLSSQIFIHCALNKIAEVAGLSGIEKVPLLTLEVLLTSAMMLMVGYFAFSHTRTVIEQLARPTIHTLSPNLTVTNLVSARDYVDSNPVESIIDTTRGATASRSTDRSQLISIRGEPEYFKVYKPAIGKDVSREKKLAA